MYKLSATAVIFILSSVLLIMTVPFAYSLALTGDKIKVCAGNWPPIMFQKDDNSPVEGFAVDVIRKIITTNGGQIEFRILPWQRCLTYLQDKGDYAYQLAPFVTYNQARARSYVFSRPWLLAKGYYVYSKKQYPSGLALVSRKEMLSSKYKICGRHGFNYQQFGVPDNNRVDRHSETLTNLLEKVQAGRCSFALAREINLVGEQYISNGLNIFNNPAFGYGIVPEMAEEKVYFMLNKFNQPKVNGNQNITGILNTYVKKYWADGTISAYASQYLEKSEIVLKRPSGLQKIKQLIPNI
ncbi:substrate-binding periplasmic protein [Piscirickettsia salmonis]|uniref:substrate-binding periplasmic protein n=1 Tax=Piscirickettsia salmonis TaxID=1238 RepID=UPI003EB8258E